MTATPEPARLNFTGSETLDVPATTAGLQQRLVELSMNLTPTIAVRTELAAVIRFKEHGSIAAGEVWMLARRFHHLGDNVDLSWLYRDGTDWLEPVYADLCDVWDNLTKLSRLEPVTGFTEADAWSDNVETRYAWRDHQRGITLRWIREVFADLTIRSGDGFGYIDPYELATLLPADLTYAVTFRYGMRWLSSPYSLGAMLESQPTSGGSCFGQGSGIVLLNTLAASVHSSLQDCDNRQQPERSAALSQLEFHWMVLKGFIYSLAHTNGSGTLTPLVHDMALLEQVYNALEAGRDILASRSRDTIDSQPWQAHGGSIHDPIETIDTTRLVATLHRAVNLEYARVAVYRESR